MAKERFELSDSVQDLLSGMGKLSAEMKDNSAKAMEYAQSMDKLAKQNTELTKLNEALSTSFSKVSNALNKASSDNDLTKYIKSQEDMIKSIDRTYRRYSRESDEIKKNNLAEELYKEVNALKAVTDNADLSNLVRNFEEVKTAISSVSSYIKSEFSVSAFKEINETIEVLEQAGLKIRNVFSTLDKGSQFYDIDRELRETREQLDLINNADISELTRKLEKLSRIAEEEFNSFLNLYNLSGSDYKFYDIFEEIRSGALTSQQAIERVKNEFDYLLIEAKSSGNQHYDILNSSAIREMVENISTLHIKIDEIITKISSVPSENHSLELFDEEQFNRLLILFEKIESSLSSMKAVFVDVGDGEEFSPLLSTIDKINTSISELSTSVKGIGLNMNIDVGSDSEAEAKVQSKISNALQAYQRLFDHIKMSGVGGSIINTSFFEFDINQYDTMMGKLQAYKKFIDNMRKEAKTEYNGKDVLYQNTDKSYWSAASAAMGQVTRAFNEMNASSDTSPLENLFGKTNLSEVISQLELVVNKLDEISTTASGFKDLFSNGLNVNSSIEEIEKLTNRVKELEDELSKVKINLAVDGNKSNISSGNPTIKDVFQNDSDSSSIAKEEASAMEQVESATEKVTESIKRENIELENQLKILSQVGEFYTDKTVKQTIKQNDGQIIARTYRQKMDKDEKGKSYPVFDKNNNIVYDEAQDVVISNFEKLEKTIVDADNALRKMEDTKKEVLKLDQTASTSFIDEQIEDQKQYITLLEETIKKISEVKIEITDELGNTSLENVYDIDPKAIQSAREKAAREYTLSTGAKQEKSDAKQSASDEQKRLKNIEQVNRALNKQQILIDSIEKSYDKTKNIDLDKSVIDKNDLAELAQKKSEIETLINKLSGQDRNSSNEAEFLQLEKLIVEYKELAKYKLKANNPSEQKLGGTNLEVAIEQQIAQYDKLIIKAEKYGDETSEIVENLKKQRDILTAVDDKGKHTATSDDYTNARDKYKIANAQVSSIEAQAKATEQEAKEIQKAWEDNLKAITDYMDAKTKLNNLEASDKKSNKKSNEIADLTQEVEKAKVKAEEARIALSSMVNPNNVDIDTWDKWLKMMEDFRQAGDGSSKSIAKLKDAIANVNTSELQTIDKYIKSAQKKLDSTKSSRDDSEKSSYFKTYEKDVQECIDAIIAERNRLENAVKSGDIELIDEGSLSNLNNLKQKLEETNYGFKTMFKGSAEVSRWKEIDTITKYMEKNTRISKEAKDKLREYIETLKTNGADANVEEIHKAFLRVCDGERKAKREGQSFLDVLRDKVWYQWAAQIGSYFSLNDILRYAKEGIQTVRELDTALVEMRKVSDESVQSLKNYQSTTFDVADAVGTTAVQIQNSTSDWLRLGYSIQEASELAKNSNIYKNVGDMEIQEATEHMISSVQAWKSEFNDNVIDTSKAVIDRYNKIGNEFAISSADIGQAMETSAAALKAGGNSLNESLGILTAANIIQQDASTTSSALKILSLRIRGRIMPPYKVIYMRYALA